MSAPTQPFLSSGQSFGVMDVNMVAYEPCLFAETCWSTIGLMLPSIIEGRRHDFPDHQRRLDQLNLGTLLACLPLTRWSFPRALYLCVCGNTDSTLTALLSCLSRNEEAGGWEEERTLGQYDGIIDPSETCEYRMQ